MNKAKKKNYVEIQAVVPSRPATTLHVWIRTEGNFEAQ